MLLSWVGEPSRIIGALWTQWKFILIATQTVCRTHSKWNAELKIDALSCHGFQSL